jgi:Zn-dependent M28 family amino/carboxypeptidase
MEKKNFQFFRFFLISSLFLISLSIHILIIAPIGVPLQNQDYDPKNGQFLLNTTLADQFNSTYAFNNIETQLDFGYRIPGTNESLECANWINTEMQEYGESALYNFSIDEIPCHNIISRINPNKSQLVIFAAHYDSRAVAEKDSNDTLSDLPIDGANDGGSGVAVLMEMARVIAASNINWNISFWFVFFDAEDQGYVNNETLGIQNWKYCEGSRWMVDEMIDQPDIYFREDQSLDSIHSFILLDMVGGVNLKFIRERNSNDDLTEEVFKIGNSLGYDVNFPLDGATISYIDDHVPFAQEGIPTLDLIIEFDEPNCGWPYHHTSGDTLENISPESLEITGRTVLQYVYETFDPELGFIEKFSSKETFFSNPIVIGAGILIIGVVIAIVIKSSVIKKY